MERRETAWLMSAASAPALARIASDERRASPRIKPLLGYLGRNLFSRELNVRRLKRACGVRDNSISNRFHREIGTPPSAYIADRRMETAAWLLRETGVEVWRLSDLLGFSSLQVFSRAFTRWSGLRPTAYRRRAARGRVTGTDTATPAALPEVEAESGWLDEDAVEALRADAIWHTLRDQPRDEQRRLVRAAASPSPALFERIHRESREQGRADRRRGVELAELAVEAVAACDPARVDPEVAGLKARAWAWVANAHWQALDVVEAERAFRCAQTWLPDSEASAERAEVLYLNAAFRVHESRLDEALALVDEAERLATSTGKPRPLAEILVQRGVVRYEMGEPARAIPELERAIALLESSEDLHLEFSARYCLASSLVETQALTEAEEQLPMIEEQCQRLGQPLFTNQVLVLWGLLKHRRGELESAERMYGKAMRGFEALDEPLLTALTALDTSIVGLKQGRLARARQLASFALRILSRLKAEREVMAAVKLLQTTVAAEQISLEAVEKVRADLAHSIRN